MPSRVLLLLALAAILRGGLTELALSPKNLFMQSDMKIPPALIKMMIGGELDRRVAQVFSQVPNKNCVAHLKAIIEGVRNREYWALNMLDASAKFAESYFGLLLWNLGNYDQCMKIKDVKTGSGSFSGQHCMLRVCMTSGSTCVDHLHNTMSRGSTVVKVIEDESANVIEMLPKLMSFINTTSIRLGVCVPSTCSAEDLHLLFDGIASQATGLIRASVVPGECYKRGSVHYEFIDICTLALYSFMFVLVVSSTLYDLTHRDPGSRKELFITFSAYTNLRKMLIASENTEGTLTCVHGIRFISILFVVLGHVYFTTPMIPCQNALAANEFMRSKMSVIVSSAFYAVDTFFVLSGLLVGYVFLNVVAEKKTMNFKAFYIHRIVRLSPALVAVLLFETSLGKKLGDGPFWGNYFNNDCGSSWWQVLFFLKNVNIFTGCMNITWYLTVDTQLYFVSPLLLIPLWKNPRRGQQLLGFVIFLGWLIPFVYAYAGQYEIPVKPFTLIGTEMEGSAILYTGTQNRFGAWAVGLWLGLTLHRIRMGHVTVRLTKGQVAVMWMYISFVGFACIMSLYPFTQTDHEYKRFWDSLYNSVNHLAWASVVSLIIFACVTGYGGPINWFLSLHSWLPWSRLTYTIYLVHYTVLYVLDGQIRSPSEFKHPLMIKKSISVLFLSTVTGAILSLMFESPITAFERILLRKVRQKDGKLLPNELEINKRKLLDEDLKK